MKRSSKLFVADILESIELIEKYTEGATDKKFFDNDALQDAVIRRLEIIGEATKNIPLEIKQENHKIPWEQMAGMRNVLSHEYFGITIKRIWDATQKDLPKLKKQIIKLLANL
jgi:uncharacterized protein with HEPN domain